MGSNLCAKRSPLLGIGIGFAIDVITIGADVVADVGSGAHVFAGPDGGLSGSSGDGDNN